MRDNKVPFFVKKTGVFAIGIFAPVHIDFSIAFKTFFFNGFLDEFQAKAVYNPQVTASVTINDSIFSGDIIKHFFGRHCVCWEVVFFRATFKCSIIITISDKPEFATRFDWTVSVVEGMVVHPCIEVFLAFAHEIIQTGDTGRWRSINHTAYRIHVAMSIYKCGNHGLAIEIHIVVFCIFQKLLELCIFFVSVSHGDDVPVTG